MENSTEYGKKMVTRRTVLVRALFMCLLFFATSSFMVFTGTVKTVMAADIIAQEVPGQADVVALDVDGVNETIIDVHVKNIHLETIEANNESFHLLKISEYKFFSEVGKPKLPAIRKTIAVPENTVSVKAVIVDSSFTSHSGYRIYPMQKPQKDGEETPAFAIDEMAYSQDSYYPEDIVKVGKVAIWRDLHIVTLTIAPVQYNPATSVLKVYDHLRVKIECTVAETTSGTTDNKSKVIEPKFDRMYREQILNYDSLDFSVGEPDYESMRDQAEGLEMGSEIIDGERDGIPHDTSIKYLSIRHEDCSDFLTLKPLLDWHKQCGLPYVSIVKTGVQTPESIKNIISTYYNNHPELEFVLLVGDITYLPWHPNWGGEEDDELPGDHWFACLTGGDNPDLWPEVAVGRLPVTDDAELAELVDKILAYSKSPPSDGWIDNVLLVAHKQAAPGKYQGCKEDIRTAAYSDSFNFQTAYGASTADGGDEATNNDVSTAINNGVGIVNYRGHGAYGFPSDRPWGTFWGAQNGANPAPWNTAGEEYWTTDALNLANGSRTPVVFSISCMNNALDNPSNDCLGEAFVMQEEGAVAFLGASRPSYTTPNHELDKNLFDALGNESIHEIGWILNDANAELLADYGAESSYMDNLKIYLWLGDPAMKMWTQGPWTFPVVSYPSDVSTGIMTVTVGMYIWIPNQGTRFIGTPGALVTIDGCGVYTSMLTDSAGKATFNFVPDNTGTMDVTVNKTNYLPYEGVVNIVPLEDAITNITFSPSSPGSLCNGDRVYANFDYTTTDPGGIQIFVRPYTDGVRTPSYAAHGSGLWPYPSGSGSGWFTITSGNTDIDEVQFTIWNHDQSELLLELFEPVDFTYGYSVHNFSLDPPSPKTLKWNDQVTVSFDYFSCEDDVRIFVRPYTNGSLSPHYAAHGSPLYPSGRGSGEGYFTITSGEIDVDALKVTLTDSASNVLFETFVPVSYHYEGYPEIDVSPLTFNIQLPVGTSEIRTLHINNDGFAPLSYGIRDRLVAGAMDGEMSSGDISRDSGALVTSSAPVTQDVSPDGDDAGPSDGLSIPDTGLTDGEFDNGVSLQDLTGVTIAYDLTHNERNPAEIEIIKNDLLARGAAIVYIEAGPITESLLAPYDILWIYEDWSETIPWLPAEQAAVQAFVESGKGLLLYGDQPGAASVLAEIFNIQYAVGGTSGYTSNISSHAITQDVSELYLQNPEKSLVVSSPSTVVVSDPGGAPSIACAEPGAGRVVVMADDYFWGPYMEYADNRLMGNQTFDWLVTADASWISESPASGLLSSGMTGDDVQLSFDASGLVPGDYFAEVCIANNDQDEAPTIATVHLTVISSPSVDFNGDGIHDIALFYPASHRWFIKDQSTPTYGTTDCLPIPGDYDGDGTTDLAVVDLTRSDGRAKWYLDGIGVFIYGLQEWIPVPGDYNGDGTADAVLFNPDTGKWYVRGQFVTTYGAGGIPVPGDYNGDGITDIAVFNPANNKWYIKDIGIFTYGMADCIPVPADYDGDGITDLAVIDTSRPDGMAKWYIRNQAVFIYGAVDNTIPVPGDYDGDGDADPCLFYQNTGKWYCRNIGVWSYGNSDMIPLASNLAIRYAISQAEGGNSIW